MKVKPHLIISHLLPGCFFLLLWLLAYNKWNFNCIKESIKGLEATSLIGLGIILLIAAFLFGEIFDSARDGAFEWLIEKISRKAVNWDFFYTQDDEKKLDRFEEYYFTWYVFNMNTASALICGGVVSHIYISAINPWFIGLWALAIILLIIDALSLRKEMVTHSK